MPKVNNNLSAIKEPLQPELKKRKISEFQN